MVNRFLNKKLKEEKGQSTIEFITTFFTAVSFVFLFLKTAINYTDGYMIHHATYMASRAYMAFDDNRDSLEEGDRNAYNHAREVFGQYVIEAMFPKVSVNELKDNSPSTVNNHAFVGMHSRFSQKFSLGAIAPKKEVLFISESFLGREPTRSESKEQICRAFAALGLQRCNRHVTIDDNGG